MTTTSMEPKIDCTAMNDSFAQYRRHKYKPCRGAAASYFVDPKQTNQERRPIVEFLPIPAPRIEDENELLRLTITVSVRPKTVNQDLWLDYLSTEKQLQGDLLRLSRYD